MFMHIFFSVRCHAALHRLKMVLMLPDETQFAKWSIRLIKVSVAHLSGSSPNDTDDVGIPLTLTHNK